MTKIVCISDTHNQHNKVTVPKCDILLHTGDATGRGSLTEYEAFADWIAVQPAKHIIVIAGNHDFICQSDPNMIRTLFEKLGVIYLFDSSATVEGLKIYGSPWQPWFHDWAFNFAQWPAIGEQEAKECWAKIPNDADIVMTHGPPYRILDKVVNAYGRDPNVGCPHLLNRLIEVKPKLHVFGHIHESYGVLEKHGIKFINASTCTLQYVASNKPVEIELY